MLFGGKIQELFVAILWKYRRYCYFGGEIQDILSIFIFEIFRKNLNLQCIIGKIIPRENLNKNIEDLT